MKTRYLALVAFLLFACADSAPPPMLNVRAVGPVASVRGELGLVAFGDTGTGGPDQRQVATAIGDYCRVQGCDMAILLGDNFYPAGVASVTDPQWQTAFVAPYRDLRFPFFVSLGNHDYDGNIQAQIDYSRLSPNWRLPARYYRFSGDDVDFFAIDTNRFDANQRRWLETGLRTSRARWRVVFGHHPVWSAGAHGDTRELVPGLLPLMRDHGDFYFAGHDHTLQVFQPVGRATFVVAGGGGAPLYGVRPDARLRFGRSAHGFTALRFTPTEARLRVVRTDGTVLYQAAFPR